MHGDTLRVFDGFLGKRCCSERAGVGRGGRRLCQDNAALGVMQYAVADYRKNPEALTVLVLGLIRRCSFDFRGSGGRLR